MVGGGQEETGQGFGNNVHKCGSRKSRVGVAAAQSVDVAAVRHGFRHYIDDPGWDKGGAQNPTFFDHSPSQLWACLLKSCANIAPTAA